MAFFSEKEQLQKFEEDELAQAYFEVLRELIAKKSIFAQQIGLKEVADYLREVFEEAGAEVTVDASYRAPFVIARFKSSNPNAKSIIFYLQIVINLGQKILSPCLSEMGSCMAEVLMMTRGISWLA